MEIKSSTSATSTAETTHTKKQGLTDQLLDRVDVEKVNAMFQQSLDAFEGKEEGAPRTARSTEDACRWDQWGRS